MLSVLLFNLPQLVRIMYLDLIPLAQLLNLQLTVLARPQLNQFLIPLALRIPLAALVRPVLMLILLLLVLQLGFS